MLHAEERHMQRPGGRREQSRVIIDKKTRADESGRKTPSECRILVKGYISKISVSTIKHWD